MTSLSPLPGTHSVLAEPDIPVPLGPARILLLATGAGVSVACLYYSQPMLGVMGAEMGISARTSGLIPTLTQLGYALGILLLSPLGDRYERRRIMLCKALLLVAALLLSGMAPSLTLLLPAALLTGLAATLAQDLVPAAATLAPAAKRGKVIGSVMTGLLAGILLSRVLSGLVADLLGWRAMFFIAAASLLGLVWAMWRHLPRFHPTTDLAYPALLASLLTLWRQHGALRRAAMAQGLLAVGFSAFWSTLALMLHGLGLGSAVAGAFGLAGAAGALVAPLAGHLADRHGAEWVARLGAGLALLAFTLLALSSGAAMATLLPVLALGALLFDLGVQASLIAHQSLVYRLDAAARSRLNALLMVCMFIGMACGSVAGSLLLDVAGWLGVMLLCVLSALAALLVRSVR
ncbi:MFS transporter [Pseudaeromonas sharmana]|uniref:MFS transporter n=1 Tax=Pseudaeromonas sharmana TaxID=328412 RepID=A0ABV8CMG7_9GAMM